MMVLPPVPFPLVTRPMPSLDMKSPTLGLTSLIVSMEDAIRPLPVTNQLPKWVQPLGIEKNFMEIRLQQSKFTICMQ